MESAPVAAAALLAAASPARAAEDAADAAAAAAAELVLPPPDLLTSGLFITAAALLVVVTAGVAYLSLMDLNDKRIEAEEREQLERDKRMGRGAPAPAASKEAWKAPVRMANPAAKAKGFGAAAKQAASQLSGEQRSGGSE